MSVSSWMSSVSSVSSLQSPASAPLELSLELHLPSFPLLLFPTPRTPRFQPPTEAAPHPEPAEPSDDSVLAGYVLATASQSTPIQRLRVVWQVSYQTRASKDAEWSPRGSFVARQVNVCAVPGALDTGQADEHWLDSGQTRFDFTMILPSTLPPSSFTPLSRVTHTVYASIIAPPPSSNSRRSSMHVPSPPYSPTESPQELPSSRRTSYSRSAKVSFDVNRPSLRHFLPDLTSPLGAGANMDSCCSSCCSDADSVSSCELAIDDADLPGGSSHGGLMLQGAIPEEPATVDRDESSFSFFSFKKPSSRTRSRSRSVRSNSSTAPRDSPSRLHSLLRFGSSSPGASARPALAVQPKSLSLGEAVLSLSDREAYPTACMPSLALAQVEIQVDALAPLRGVLPTLEWQCQEYLPGLGPVAIQTGSNLAALGSAFNLHMHMPELLPTLTIHFLTVSLLQFHATSDPEDAGARVDLGTSTEYMLHRAGNLRRHGHNGRPTLGGYVWRGAVGRALEAAEAPRPAPKRGKSCAKTAPLSSADMGPGGSATDRTFSLDLPLRLPSPVVGAIPGTPAATVMPAGTQRTLHKLKFEVYFSVLGEDEMGAPWPGASSGGDGLGTQRKEGGLRKCLIQRTIQLAPCSATPDNLILPPYDPEHALRTLNERPCETSSSKRLIPLKDPKSITLMPKTNVPATDPHHGLHARSCLCFWSAEELEKHVGVYARSGMGCEAPRRGKTE